MTPRLSAEKLEVGYLGKAILPPISVTVNAGEFWGIAGSNGSGKTTFLRSLLGLLPSIGGGLQWPSDSSIGYVPQRMNLDLSMPARAIDVIRGGTVHGWSFLRPIRSLEVRETVEQVMEETDTTSLARQPLRELSEGQKQRVLMARALVSQPNVLILDEPTSAMDAVAEMEMLQLLDRLRETRDLAIILVSHNLMGMASVATHAMLLDREHQLIIDGDIRDVAVHHEVQDHFGRLMRSVVEERFGPLPDPEECHACNH